ncbi:MAG: electron transfer flavoprotein subunit alpha/FixB family protein [Myxococcales bacterium]|nr:electron transfer flavoprotein subunit alpha/FixB family protein [Myxococcales bacterium]MBK7196494.1 electron transfer flavoprotein subunit alpha/FixB family protein [Myxococcales bacterium]MBP6848992.1 electron transfer flavoprotein subunit alpha/FixB family protein [Kofleriaceae bacterium]
MALAILGEGRRIASSLGGALYAVAWVAPGADVGTPAQELAAALGGGGADRVVLVAGPPRPALWVTRGALLARVCEQVRPSLIILPSDAGGRDVAPRLAARLGAAYVAEPVVETGPRGEVVLTRAVYDGELWRRLQLDELDQAAVITLSADRPAAHGADEAELVALGVDGALPAAPLIVGERADAGEAIDQARVLVVAGAGVSAGAMPLVERLAALLGGEVAGTRGACARGLVAPDREIGVGARGVHPELYVVCGASGSNAHLGAVSLDAEIIAIDRDPRAPIFRAARWGLVGALEDVLPALVAALEARP